MGHNRKENMTRQQLAKLGFVKVQVDTKKNEIDKKILKIAKKIYRQELNIVAKIMAEKGMDTSNCKKNSQRALTLFSRDFLRREKCYTEMVSAIESKLEKKISELDYRPNTSDELSCRIILRKIFSDLVQMAIVQTFEKIRLSPLKETSNQ